MANRFLTMALLALTATCNFDSVSAAERENIIRTFEKYTQAAINNQGENVADSMSSRTINAYAAFREQALYGAINELDELTPYERFSVLHLRHRLTLEQLQEMDAREILAHSCNMGWNSKKALNTINDLGDLISYRVDIDGSQAQFTLVLNDKSLPPSFSMVKEEGEWKIDQAATYPYINERLEARIAASGLPANELLLDMLQTATGRRADSTILSPLLQR